MDAPGIVVMGGSGRMGRMLCDLILASDDMRLAGVTEAPGHAWAGQDLGTATGGAPNGVPVTDDPISVVARAQAVIDFTTPAATVAMADLCAQVGTVHVIGTTGLSADDIAALDRAAQTATIIRAGNMSLGVNLLTQLVRQVAASLDDYYDIEVIEAHHRHKVDAPSGTALMLGEAAAEGRGVSLHDVVFAADGERIVLRHVASDRSVFARGALKAALWGQGKPPGSYDMLDVLGMR